MKQLILVRHADSDWGNPALTDIKRPLNRCGSQSAPVMGQQLRCLGIRPQSIICSPALRARETASLLAAELGFAETEIVCDPRIYEAEVVDLMAVIRGLDEVLGQVLLVGHNPAISDLAALLGDAEPGPMVPCAAVGLICEAETWWQVEGGGRTLFHNDPKNPPPSNP